MRIEYEVPMMDKLEGIAAEAKRKGLTIKVVHVTFLELAEIRDEMHRLGVNTSPFTHALNLFGLNIKLEQEPHSSSSDY